VYSLLVVKVRQGQRVLVFPLPPQQLLERGLGRRFVLLEVDVARLSRHARSRGDETADDDVFLQAAQVVDAVGDRGLGEDSKIHSE
jgi:hypothetical protein